MSIMPSTNLIHTLIVEESASAAAGVAQALSQKFGARMAIITCADSAAALALVHDRQIDLVVANVRLATGNGLDLCKTLRAQPHSTEMPILLIGEKTSARDKIAGFLSGADDYVVRPIDDRLLAARIELLWRLKGIGRLH